MWWRCVFYNIYIYNIYTTFVSSLYVRSKNKSFYKTKTCNYYSVTWKCSFL